MFWAGCWDWAQCSSSLWRLTIQREAKVIFLFHFHFSPSLFTSNFHFHFPNIQQEAEVIFSSMEMFRNIKCPIMSVQYSEAWLRNVHENPQCSMLHGNYWAKLGILNVQENVQSSMLQGNGWEGSWHRRKKTRWDGWKALGLQERGQVLINQNQSVMINQSAINPDKSITHNDNMTWGEITIFCNVWSSGLF